MDSMTVGKTIAKLRKKLGITQTELAGMLNVTDKAISKWECGQGYPEITQLPALSKIFGVPIDYIIKGNSKGIVIAGNILADIVCTIDKYPQKGMLTNILSQVKSVGGCVPNTIIDIAKMDSEVYLTALGKVGNDENGKYVLNQLKSNGIDIINIKVSSDKPTSCTYVMAEENTGERTFFHDRGANSEFCAADIDIDSLDCEIFHIGYILLLDEMDKKDDEYGTQMARVLHDVQAKGIRTSIDVVSEEGDRFAEKVVPALKYCNFAIMNEIESCMVTGLDPKNSDGSINIDNIHKTMEKFIEYGVKEKVIIHCREAGFSLSANGEFTVVPSLELPSGFIKGNVGAGDAFAAGSLYGLYRGFSDKEILEFASAAAAYSLSEADATSGMQPKEKIYELEKSLKRLSL